MKIHELKTDPQMFEQSLAGNKPFELRLDDRNFQVGDFLVLRETQTDGHSMSRGSPLVYTGRRLERLIISKITDYGLFAGWCILGISEVRKNFLVRVLLALGRNNKDRYML